MSYLFSSGVSVREYFIYFFISIHVLIASFLKWYALYNIRYEINYEDEDDRNTYNEFKITIIKKIM